MRSYSNTAARGRVGLVLACLIALVGAPGVLSAQENGSDSLYFIQVSDTHWGFNNPTINPDFVGTLKKGIAEINSLPGTPTS